MGSTGAKGAFNFVDGKYIQPFAFNPDNLGSHDTFVISRGQFTEMYEQEPGFRDLINTHQYIYADGHVCCNLPQFIRKAGKSMALTAWALAMWMSAVCVFIRYIIFQQTLAIRLGNCILMRTTMRSI